MRSNIVLIGMPGAGKSTIGVLLARQLGYAFLDTDLLIQEREGKRLQEVVDAMGQDAFRAYEEKTCAELEAERTVISTGGSVVYFPRAMTRFAELGAIVWLEVPFPEIERRVAAFPDRGLAIRPGQTLADLYAEREPLYARYAELRLDCGQLSPAEIVHELIERLQGD